MIKKLRDYQQECLDEMVKHDKQLIQLPTGSGKTFIFLNHLKKHSKCALIVVPTIDLKMQIFEESKNFMNSSEICIDNTLNGNKIKIYIIVANSLCKSRVIEKLKSLQFDHIIIDEAHKSACNTYVNFLEEYQKVSFPFKLIGFTATPERLDKKSLLNIFKIISYKKSIIELIEKKFLCNIKAFRITTGHKIEAKGKTPDFSSIELRKLDSYSRNKLIYDTYLQNCRGHKTVIFCLSVEHAEKLADYLRKEKKVKCAHISGFQNINHRIETINKFKSGQIECITNCQLLTEGFDEPSIDRIIIARPTKSKSLYCQMIGRGARLFPGKTHCEVYELTDNTHKICTFNVAADEKKDSNFIKDYKPGIFLTDLHKEISEISLSDYVINKSEILLINKFSDFLKSKGILDSQKKKLFNEILNKNYVENMYEAAFLLFIEKLKEKYG